MQLPPLPDRNMPLNGSLRPRWASGSVVVFLLLALFQVSAASVAVAASKLQQLAVPVEGHTLTLWAGKCRVPKAAIVLIHGRTWSALPDFDLQVKGRTGKDSRSVMQSLNALGYSAYALDRARLRQEPARRDGLAHSRPCRARCHRDARMARA